MYIKRRLVWFRNNTPIIIDTGIVSASCFKTEDPVNNTCTITLLDFDILYSNGNFLPEEGDLMYYYSKEVRDNSNSSFTDNDIIWTGKFIDYRRIITTDDNSIELRIGDWSYDFNNRYHSMNYVDKGLKTNEILIDVIKNKVENDSGTGTFKLNFNNVSSLRNDNSSFPVLNIAFSRPTHEWVQQLSSVAFINSEEELSTGRVIDENMVFDIRGINVYWYEVSDTPIMTIDINTIIHSIEYSTRNEEKSNFLILECGEDFNGDVIYHYAVDERYGGKIQKDEKQTPLNLAGRNQDYDNEFHQLRKNYSLVTNIEFIEKVKILANSYAQEEFRRMGQEPLRVTLDRFNFNIGDFIKVNLPNFIKEDFIIKSITHNDGDQESTTSVEMVRRLR